MSKIQKPQKPKLSIKEISRNKELMRAIMEQKRDGENRY